RHARVERQRERERQRQGDERRRHRPDERVAGRFPEHVVARQDLPKVLKPDVLVLHAEIHPERVQAVVEGDEHRIDREGGVEEDRGPEEDRDGVPRTPAAGAARGRPREDQRFGGRQGYLPLRRASSSLARASSAPISLFGSPWFTAAT